jgi:hypothetical protein
MACSSTSREQLFVVVVVVVVVTVIARVHRSSRINFQSVKNATTSVNNVLVLTVRCCMTWVLR